MPFSRQELADVHAAVVRSLKEKDAALFASLYTQDGVLYPPDGQAIRGRTQIERAFGEFLDAGFVDQQVEVVEFDSDERIAVEEGRAAGTFRSEEGDTIIRSNYLIVHRLDADGVWRMQYDMFTTIPEGESGGTSY